MDQLGRVYPSLEPRPPFPEPGFQAKYMLTYSLEEYVILIDINIGYQYTYKKTVSAEVINIGSIHAYIHSVLQ